MTARNVLIFETSSTLSRAFELALAGSDWTVKTEADPELVPVHLEAFNPDVAVLEKKQTSEELVAAVKKAGVRIVFSAAAPDSSTGEIARPFTTKELFEALENALQSATATPSEAIDIPEAEPVDEPDGFEDDDGPLIVEPVDESNEDMPEAVPETDVENNVDLWDEEDTPAVREEPETDTIPSSFSEDGAAEEKDVDDDPVPEGEPLEAPDVNNTGEKYKTTESPPPTTEKTTNTTVDAPEHDLMDDLREEAERQQSPSEQLAPDAGSETPEHPVDNAPVETEETPRTTEESDVDTLTDSDSAVSEEVSAAQKAAVPQKTADEKPMPDAPAVDRGETDLSPGTDEDDVLDISSNDLVSILPDTEETDSAAVDKDSLRELIRQELTYVMRDVFWEEAPDIVREVVERKIETLYGAGEARE